MPFGRLQLLKDASCEIDNAGRPDASTNSSDLKSSSDGSAFHGGKTLFWILDDFNSILSCGLS